MDLSLLWHALHPRLHYDIAGALRVREGRRAIGGGVRSNQDDRPLIIPETSHRGLLCVIMCYIS